MCVCVCALIWSCPNFAFPPPNTRRPCVWSWYTSTYLFNLVERINLALFIQLYILSLDEHLYALNTNTLHRAQKPTSRELVSIHTYIYKYTCCVRAFARDRVVVARATARMTEPRARETHTNAFSWPLADDSSRRVCVCMCFKSAAESAPKIYWSVHFKN